MNIDPRHRPDKAHYHQPPNRRRPSVSLATPVIPPPPPPAPIPPLSPYINSPSLSSSILHDSPASHYTVPHPHHEPPLPPPQLRPEIPVHTNRSATHMSPAMHRRDSGRVELIRDAPRLRTTHDGLYTLSGAPFESNVAAGKYGSPRPTHIIRERSYDRDRYEDLGSATVSYRSKRPPLVHDGLRSSPTVPQVRILRNPDRDRERLRRELTDEHVGRTFVRPDLERSRTHAADGSGAQYMGEKIHNLTPSTSLKERVAKFISNLSPDIPDLPEEDEPYEYPSTIPCDPKTLPDERPPEEIKRAFAHERPGWIDPDIAPHPAHFRAKNNPIRLAESRRPYRSDRPSARRYYTAGYESEEDDCVRGIYRLRA